MPNWMDVELIGWPTGGWVGGQVAGRPAKWAVTVRQLDRRPGGWVMMGDKNTRRQGKTA